MGARIAFVRAGRATPWEAGILVELEKLGYDPFFVCSSYANTVPMKYQRKGWNFRSSPFLDRTFNRSMPAKGVSYFLRVRTLEYVGAFVHPSKLFSDIDVLHLVDESYLTAYQALKYVNRSVMTFWENIPFNYDLDYKIPSGSIRPKVFSKVSHFFPVSDAARETLLWHGIEEERLTKVHPGVDLSLFKRTNDVQNFKDSISAGDVSILLGVARVEYFKGLTFVLRALRELKDMKKDFIYVHVGSGPKRFTNYLKDIVKKFGLESNVIFLGAIEYTQMPLIYSSSIATLLPSLPMLEWEEQMGFSILEAMACGSHPIVSDTPSLDEVVPEDVGTRVPTGNHKALADAVRKIIDDKALQKRAIKEGPTYVQKNYNATLSARTYADTYRKIFQI